MKSFSLKGKCRRCWTTIVAGLFCEDCLASKRAYIATVGRTPHLSSVEVGAAHSDRDDIARHEAFIEKERAAA
jgi:hypothetical protein